MLCVVKGVLVVEIWPVEVDFQRNLRGSELTRARTALGPVSPDAPRQGLSNEPYSTMNWSILVGIRTWLASFERVVGHGGRKGVRSLDCRWTKP